MIKVVLRNVHHLQIDGRDVFAKNLPANGGQLGRVEFSGGDAELSTAAQAALKQIATAVGPTERRVQLNAYAGGTAETVSVARRLSLSRALAVRSFLIDAGVRSTRIDVRALGIAEDTGPAERVDVVLLPL